jgi:hypothetical protein
MNAALALLLALVAQEGAVDPLSVFYMADFHDPNTMGEIPIPRGRLSARSLTPPYRSLKTAEQTYVSGALAVDPVRGVLYGSRCCRVGAPIFAHDARTLEVLDDKTLDVQTSGSITLEVDALRRVLFVFDGPKAELAAISIASNNYGQKLSTLTPPGLAPEPKPDPLKVQLGSAASDAIAVDTGGSLVFMTGVDGGPVLAIDYSGIYPTGGSFGAASATGHIARSSNNTGGSLAFDEAGRRVFYIPAHGIVRVFSAAPPYTTLGEIIIDRMSFSDCGLFFDGRNQTLYVGREIFQGVPERPLGIDLSNGFPGVQNEVAPNLSDGTDPTIYGVSFAGPTGIFSLPPEETSPVMDPIAAREAVSSCRSVEGETSLLWVAFLAGCARLRRR